MTVEDPRPLGLGDTPAVPSSAGGGSAVRSPKSVPSSAHRTPQADDDRTLADHEDSHAGGADAYERFEQRFELHNELGRGAFGRVYRAWDQKLGRWVAVKLAREPDGKSANLLLREARAAAQLRHSQIVHIYDVGKCEHGWYIITDYIAGESLRVYLSKQRPSLETAVRWTSLIARALHYAHQQGIIHRDIKPSNILIDEKGEPHLLDFGLAHLAAGTDTLAGNGQQVGTPAYMAPEQITPKFGPITPATDVFALGNVFFELLTGQAPFEGDSRSVMFRTTHEEPPSLIQAMPRVPPELDAIYRQARARLPSERFKSCGEFADRLDEWSQRRNSDPEGPGSTVAIVPPVLRESPEEVRLFPVSPSPDSPTTAPARQRLSRRMWFAGTGAVALGSLGFYWYEFIGPGTLLNLPRTVVLDAEFGGERVPAELRFVPVDKDGQPHPEVMARGIAGQPISLMPGRYIVVATFEGEHQEVLRTVPRIKASTWAQLPHAAAAWDAEQRRFRLPGIRIQSLHDLADAMAHVQGGEVTAGTKNSPFFYPPQRFMVAPFYIDPQEVTAKQWNEALLRSEPLWREGGVDDWDASQFGFVSSQPPDEPYRGASPAVALRVAESLGKSLPTWPEWVFVVTDGNRRKWPWGDEPPGDDEKYPWPPDAASERDVTADRMRIRGLVSGPAEPTQSFVWQPPNAMPIEAGMENFMPHLGVDMLVCGGPLDYPECLTSRWKDQSDLIPANAVPLRANSNCGLRTVHRLKPRF